MWPRFGETLVAVWLVASPFIFPSAAGGGWPVVDVLAGVFAFSFAIGSLWRPVSWLHFVNLGIAGVLVLPSYLYTHPAPEHIQNRIIAGMVLGIFALVPTDVNRSTVREQNF